MPSLSPPMPYYGSKQSIADQVVDLLPPHRHYVEPYGGSLAVLLAKPVSVMETVNDLDASLMTFWRVLRDRPEDLARVCALTPHSRQEFQDARERSAGSELEVARQVWVQLTQSRGATRRNVGWRHYVAGGTSSMGMPGYLDGYVRRMYAAAERLHHVSLEARPGLEIIANYGAADDVLLYVDPPYLGSTRGVNYHLEMTSVQGHTDLAGALLNCRSAVVISGYASPLYEELYTHWHRHEIRTSSGNAHDRTRTEVVWSNREPTPALFSTKEAVND